MAGSGLQQAAIDRGATVTANPIALDAPAASASTPPVGYQPAQNFTISGLPQADLDGLIRDARGAYQWVSGAGRIVSAAVTSELSGGDVGTAMFNAFTGVAGETLGAAVGGEGLTGRVMGAFVAAELASQTGQNGVGSLAGGLTNIARRLESMFPDYIKLFSVPTSR